MNRAWRRWANLALKLLCAVGLLTWLASSGRLNISLFAAVLRPWELGALTAITFAWMAILGFRWWWLLRIQQLREPLGTVLALTWAGYFAAQVLPGGASGDLAKGYLILRRQPHARSRAFSTVLADRAIGLHSLLLLGALAFAWLLAHGVTEPAVLAMAASTVLMLLGITFGGAALLFAPSRKALLRILPGSWREAWDQSFQFYCLRKVDLLGCYVLSLISSSLTVASFGLAGWALGHEVAWGATFLAGPLVVVANCLPLTPGGIGLAEVVSSGLFGGLGAPWGAEIMLMVRLCGVAVSLPGSLSLFGLGVSRKRSLRQVSALQPKGLECAIVDNQ